MRRLSGKYYWLLAIALFLAVSFLSSLFRYRIDLTAERRFSLSKATRNMLSELDSPVLVRVYLAGDLPPEYRKLSVATADMLSEFSEAARGKLRVVFEEPGKGLSDTARAILYDSLYRLGAAAERVQDQRGDKSESRVILPSALVFYGNRQAYPVDLRNSKTLLRNFSVMDDERANVDREATLNAAEALLEFKFANSIEKLTRKRVPTIGYLIGNGEAGRVQVNDLVNTLTRDYRFGVFDLKAGYPDPSKMELAFVVKPTQPFTDEDKLRIDQYVMRGGKVIWCVDKLYAELDSLMRSQADFVAFDRNLNLDDLLFRYGARINGDLVQDLNCSKIPLVVGYNPDNSPQMQRVPWPYYPFLFGGAHPISANIDRVLSIFPASLDTVSAPGVTKTILLATDTNSRAVTTPALVSLNTTGVFKTEAELQAAFRRSHIPVAALLEGSFRSLFANRLTGPVLDSIRKNTGTAFSASSPQTAQVVISDADIATNSVTRSEGPLSMGMIPFENYRFANREFIQNCVDYLAGDRGIFQTRNKNITLRLLDKARTGTQKLFWQVFTVALPVVLILCAGLLFEWRRKRIFTRPV